MDEVSDRAIYETEASNFTARRSGWFIPLIVILACVLTSIPVFLTVMPPVMDFPNHMARIWLLGGGLDSPPLSHIYEARWWQASTNVAVDFIGSLIVRLAGLEATAKVLLAAMFIGPALGVAFLNRKIFGGFHPWQIIAVMLMWSTPAVEGFLSFQIGLAAALFTAAAVPLSEGLTAGHLAFIAVTSAVLLLIHPFAVVLFLGLATGFALGERWLPIRELVRRRGVRVIAYGAAILLPLILLFLLAPHPPGANGAGSHIVHWNPISETIKPKSLALLYLSPFISYRVALDLAFIVPLLGVIIWAASRSRVHMHAGLVIVAAGFLLVAPTLPTNIGDGGALPIRFVLMGMLILAAATRPEFRSPRARSAFALALAVIALARIGAIAWIWHERAKDVDELQSATRELPPAASVMVLQQKWPDETSRVPLGRFIAGCPGGLCAAERHFGSLIVPWRHAFIPMLFTVPGQHPLGVKPPWNRNAVYSSGIVFADEIYWGNRHDGYLKAWQTRFGYVLVLNADLGHTVIPYTKLITDTGFARLYRVVPNKT